MVAVAAMLLLPVTPASAALPGCPETREADLRAKGTVAQDFGWWFNWVAAPELWHLATGKGVKVAVVDTGVNEHRQLAPALGGGVDLVKGLSGGRLDCIGHGTAVASIIAARPGGRGLVGIAPEAEVIPIRVAEDGGGFVVDERQAPAARVAAGIRSAADAGARIINVSLALKADSGDVRSAVEYAQGKGAIVVAAVGGEGAIYPAAYPSVIGVGAFDRLGQRAPATESYVDVYAPGYGGMTVAARDTDHFVDWQGGADAATAVVSGTAALIVAAEPALTNTQVITRLLRTAQGRTLDPYRAVTELLPNESAVASRSPGPPLTAPVVPTSSLPQRALGIAGLLGLLVIGIVVIARLWRSRRQESQRT